ncbi:MAG: transaldolase [candidate division FCPU426 bacterium]
MIPDLRRLKIKLFADGADLKAMGEAYRSGLISGFTTNPTLMRKAGVADYAAFARQALALIPDLPISFEVFSDEFADMERQARLIAAWGPNVNVKIPVTNTRGEFSGPLLERLTAEGVSVNVTACASLEQVKAVAPRLAKRTASIVSVFAGRVADTGRDPIPLMKAAKRVLRSRPACRLLWASPREVLNIFQAEASGCDIITLTPDIQKKLGLIGRGLEDVSLDTVKMFDQDAKAAGFTL